MDTPEQIAREMEMYGEGAELDLALAKHFFALARGSEDREDAVAYGREYNRCMRSMRQSLAFRGRLRKQEREHEKTEARETDTADRAAAVETRKAEVRARITPHIRLEREDEVHEHELLDDLEKSLAREARGERFLEIPVPVMVARLCAGLLIDPPRADDEPPPETSRPAPDPADPDSS